MTRSVLLAVLATLALHAQPARNVPKTFDVASIKANQVGGGSRQVSSLPGGEFVTVNASLKLLISRAYGVPEAQVEGPRWIETDTWDISAKVDTAIAMERDEFMAPLQALLAERFQLKVRRTTKDGPILSLVVAKGGPKLTANTGEGSESMSSSSGDGKVSITGTKATMSRLAERIGQRAGRPVIDNTGLKGEYDFYVEWSSDQADPSGVSPFAAVEDQLGLKLESARGPIETIVVESAQKASAN